MTSNNKIGFQKTIEVKQFFLRFDLPFNFFQLSPNHLLFSDIKIAIRLNNQKHIFYFTLVMEPHQSLNGNQHVQENNNISNSFWQANDRNNCLLTLLNLQTKCNLELIKNQMLIHEFAKLQKDQKQREKGSSQTSTSTSTKNKIGNPSIQVREKRRKPRAINNFKKMEESSYEPQQFEDYEYTTNYKISQSKNIPKSFGKSIISFIKKNTDITNKILRELNIDSGQFDKTVNKYKGKINTIIQLRSLWLEQDNQFAQAFRILSQIYLKKFSLSHIFNSRIENHSKHLKYRTKILESIQKPQQFTHMKDY